MLLSKVGGRVFLGTLLDIVAIGTKDNRSVLIFGKHEMPMARVAFDAPMALLYVFFR